MRIATITTLLFALAACDPPALREYEVEHKGLVRGTVFYPAGAQRGNVIVLLFKSDNLPPPTGSGGPGSSAAAGSFWPRPRGQPPGRAP